MLTGELIFNGETVTTPSIPRGGSKAVFAINGISRSSAATLTAVVQHKNIADTVFSVVTGGTIIMTTGIGTVSVSALKEEVRLEMIISGSSSDWLRAFVFNPTWQE